MRVAGNVFGSPVETETMKEDGNSSQEQEQNRHLHSLIKEQYGQFLIILESFQGGTKKSANKCINGGTVNFAGFDE